MTGKGTPGTVVEVATGTAEPTWDEWDTLADVVDASPFNRPGWVRAWRRAFGRGTEVLLAARRGGRLVGVLPLERRGGVLASPTNWHTPEFVPVCADAEAEAALFTGALERNRQRLQVAFLGEDVAERLRRRSAWAGQPAITRELGQAPYIDVEGVPADYVRTLGRNLLSDVRRRRRRLAEVGEVAVEVVDEADEHRLGEFLRVEASGWKGRHGTAIASVPAVRGFYEDVARWAAGRGWLRLALLRVSGRVIAGDLAIECAGVHYVLKTGFDPAYAWFSPGKLLRHAMVERAFADRLRRYEFLGMQADWKRAWTDTAQTRLAVIAFAPTLRGRVDRAVQAYGRPVAVSVLAGGRGGARR